MSMLAVVDMLNSVPPGAPVPEGAVVFAMPGPLMLAIGLALAFLPSLHPTPNWRRPYEMHKVPACPADDLPPACRRC